jgi:hypothetical protein
MRRPPHLLALALVLSACGDPTVSRPDARSIIDLDGGAAAPPTRPDVTPPPAVQPYALLSLRGRAEGRRLYVEGTGNRRSYGIQPDGTFCADVPLPSPSTYDLYVVVQARDGQLSERAGPFTVTYDPSAPPIDGATTCTGADPAGCGMGFEICDNGRDDDCNNLIDAEDPLCAPCTEDLLEENDQVGSPRIAPDMVYEDLQICPSDPDWFGVYAEAGQTIDAVIRFEHAEGNLDLELVAPNRRDVLRSSRTLMDEEVVSHTATTAGTHHLHVFGSDITANGYRLELSVRGP